MEANAVVHLIDDDEAVRHALAFLLMTSGFAVRAYESAEAFLKASGGAAAGCVVSDVRMPGMDGLALQRHLAGAGIGLPVIIMTGHADVPLAVEAMKAGAVDFIEKPFDDEILLAAVRLALDNENQARSRSKEMADISARLESLSTRERQVLDGLVAGHANKTIAYDLQLSPRTVEVHRANVMVKMGAGSLSDLVRMTLMAGGNSPG